MESLDLSFFFKTKNEASDFSTRIATIAQKIYETNFNLEQSLSTQLGIQKKDAFITLLRDNNINATSNTDLKTFFDTIQKTISSLSVLTLTLAFQPSDKTLQAVSEWFILNIKKQVLFDIQVDKNLIAGAVITYNGKYLDASIRQKFNLILKKALSDVLTQPTPNNPAQQIQSKPTVST